MPSNDQLNLQLAQRVEHGPETSELDRKRMKALATLREAQKAWYDYFGECEVGPERTRASEVYENVRNAARIR